MTQDCQREIIFWQIFRQLLPNITGVWSKCHSQLPYSGKLLREKSLRFCGYLRRFLCKILGCGIFWWHQRAFCESFLAKILYSTLLPQKFPSIWYPGTPRSMSLNSACILICSLTTNSFFEILVWAWKEVHLQEPSCHINSNITS